MRLLLVGINYAPEESGNAPYTTGLAEHLVERGHEVHVLAGFPHYPSWRRDPSFRTGAAETRNGVHVHRSRHYVPGSQSALKRALYEASFLGSATKLLSLPRPDAILGIVPTLSDGILTRVASRRFGVPYGLVFQDLMGQAARQSGLPGAASVDGLVRAGERWAVHRAAAVAIVAESFRDYVQRLGVPSKRIARVRNWNQTPPVSSTAAWTRERLGWPADAFVCLHAGNMGFKQGLMNLVECARLAAASHPALLFVLAGDGNQRKALAEKAASYRLTNLRFLASQSSADHADMLAAADLLVLNQSASVRDMSFPSKVSSYVTSGTPVIAAVSNDSAAAVELNESGAALLVDSGSPEKLLKGIERLQQDALLRRRLLVAARRYSGRFSREDALCRLEAFVEVVAGGDQVAGVEVQPLQEAA